MDNKIGIAVIGSRASVDKHKFISPVIVDKSRRGIDVQRRSAHDHHVGGPDVFYRSVKYILVKAFFIQHDIGPDHAAAAAARHAAAVIDHVGGIGLAAFGAIGAQDATVQFEHVFAAGSLVQSVYVLRDHGAQLSFPLKLRKTQMNAVGLHALDDELGAMEAVILLRVFDEKAVAQDRLGRVFPLLVVQTVDTAEIRDPAFRTDARAAEKDDVVAFRDPFFEFIKRGRKW